MKVKTVDHDLGFGKILQSMKELEENPYVKVGFLSGDIVTIAATNEFGTTQAGRGRNVKIPERSFLRSTHDEKAEHWTRLMGRMKLLILTGRMGVKEALIKAGLIIQSAVREKINSNLPPENAESTLAAKAPGTKTLIDTGRMIQSVKFQVFKK